jgi:hypothetical protein
MALYRDYKFDTSVVKQKVLEVYVKDSLNIKSIFVFNGYCLGPTDYSIYEKSYYDDEIIGITYFADLDKNTISNSLFRVTYGIDDFEIQITNNELSKKYEQYKQDYEIMYTEQALIRKDASEIKKAYYSLGVLHYYLDQKLCG